MFLFVEHIFNDYMAKYTIGGAPICICAAITICVCAFEIAANNKIYFVVCIETIQF